MRRDGEGQPARVPKIAKTALLLYCYHFLSFFYHFLSFFIIFLSFWDHFFIIFLSFLGYFLLFSFIYHLFIIFLSFFYHFGNRSGFGRSFFYHFFIMSETGLDLGDHFFIIFLSFRKLVWIWEILLHICLSACGELAWMWKKVNLVTSAVALIASGSAKCVGSGASSWLWSSWFLMQRKTFFLLSWPNRKNEILFHPCSAVPTQDDSDTSARVRRSRRPGPVKIVIPNSTCHVFGVSTAIVTHIPRKMCHVFVLAQLWCLLHFVTGFYISCRLWCLLHFVTGFYISCRL